MKQELHGKKILYIGQSFFGYEVEIKKAMESMGASVDYFNERPKSTFMVKLLLKLKIRFLLRKNIIDYYDEILNQTKNIKYDYVFVNKLETINLEIMNKIKNIHSTSKYILYKWDSIDNYSPHMETLNLFDRAFTFDNKDAENFDKLNLLPLFYIPIYENICKERNKYDLCFIGSGHSDRYAIVSKLKSQAEKKQLTVFTFLYLGTKIMYYFRKIFDTRIKKSKINDFSFSPLNQEEIVKLISMSNVVIDIEHPSQNGLTMRTIEMIGAKKKLITTNKNILNYDFYNSNNIYIIDRDKPYLDIEFLNLAYQELELKIYEKYSIANWIKTMFIYDDKNIKYA